MKPTAITADRSKAVLSITWDDGQRTDYPFYELAAACPCEVCATERDKLAEQGLDPAATFKPQSSELLAIEPVGAYAINIAWKDGCRYGIYSWDYLLELVRRRP